MTVVKDEACGLPEMLPVLLYDGMVEQRRVNWNEVPDTRVTGEYDVTGNVEACSVCCTCEDLRGGRAAGGGESVARCRLGRRPGALERRKSEDAVAVQLFPEFVDPFPAPPVNAVRVEAPKTLRFRSARR